MNFSKKNILCAFMLVVYLTSTLRATEPISVQSQTPNVAWSAELGSTYVLETSHDLDAWEPMAGYPQLAETPIISQAVNIAPGQSVFLRVREVDVVAPMIHDRMPEDGDFGVDAGKPIVIELADPSGLSNESLRLTFNGQTFYDLNSPELSWDGTYLVYTPGTGSLIGAPGEVIELTLESADTLGNAGTETWSFTVAPETVVANNIFVFGSDAALALGQESIAPIYHSSVKRGELNAREPPLREGWLVETVAADHLIIDYADDPPTFAIDQLVCNATPKSKDEIFYRRIVSVTLDDINHQVRLDTEDVPLTEFLQSGVAVFDEDAVALTGDAEGQFVKALSINRTKNLGTFGIDERNLPILGNDLATLEMREATFLYSQTLRIVFAVVDRKVERFSASINGSIRAALVPQVNFAVAHSSVLTDSLYGRDITYRFVVSGVPVWVSVDLDVVAEAGIEAGISGMATVGVRQQLGLDIGVDYQRGRDPSFTWGARPYLEQPTYEPLSYSFEGEATAHVSLIPALTIRIYSVAGVKVEVDPTLQISGQINGTSGSSANTSWQVVADADLSVGLSVVGVADDDLPQLAALNLYHWEWTKQAVQPLAITHQPETTHVKVGGTAILSVQALGPVDQLNYQWYYDGMALSGETSPNLILTDIKPEHEGAYQVKVWWDDESVESIAAFVLVDELPDSQGVQRFTVYDDLKGYYMDMEYLRTKKSYAPSKQVNDLRGLRLLKSLEVLDLSSSEVYDVHIRSAPNLKEILTGSRDLTSVRIDGPTKMVEISFRIHAIKSFILGDQPLLERIDLWDNGLELFQIAAAPKLNRIFLVDNNLKQLKLGDLPSLESLSVGDNAIENFQIGMVPRLRILSLYGNALRLFSLPKAESLEELWLGGNLLSSFSSGIMPNLTLLRLEDNSLSEIDLTKYPKLEVLNLSENLLSFLDVIGNPSLTSCSFEHNKLTELTISDLAELIDISAGYNRLTKPNLGSFPKLEYISLLENYIDFSPGGAGSELKARYAGSSPFGWGQQLEWPANREFAKAEILATEAQISSTTLGALAEIGEPKHAGLTEKTVSVWYRFVADFDGPLYLGASSEGGVALALYSGTGLVDLQPVASSTLGTSSELSFPAQAHTTYFLAVVSRQNEMDDFSLKVSSHP